MSRVVGGVLRSQEHVRSGALERLAYSPHGHHARAPLAALGLLRRKRSGNEGRPNGPWRYSVDTNSALHQLQSQASSEGQDGALGGCVIQQHGSAHICGDRGRVDDTASLLHSVARMPIDRYHQWFEANVNWNLLEWQRIKQVKKVRFLCLRVRWSPSCNSRYGFGMAQKQIIRLKNISHTSRFGTHLHVLHSMAGQGEHGEDIAAERPLQLRRFNLLDALLVKLLRGIVDKHIDADTDRPIPESPPVTIATFPSNFPASHHHT